MLVGSSVGTLGVAGLWTVNVRWLQIAVDCNEKSRSLDRKSITVVSIPLKGPYVLLMTTLEPACLNLEAILNCLVKSLQSFQRIP